MRILSRTTALALKQVQEVMNHLPGEAFEIVGLESFGDKHREISLKANNAPDFFTRELDEALIAGRGDIAIHSAKDLPCPLPKGLTLIAVLGPVDPSDSLVSKGHLSLLDLPRNAKIGTSSIQREQSLLQVRDDLEFIDIRGSIEQRLAILDQGGLDGVIIATCALIRLGLENRIAERLSFKTHPLQGYLAVVAKIDRPELSALFSDLDVRKAWGKVYLVGAGPGPADLITIRGKAIIDHSDVVLYDDLLDKNMLKDTQAECIYVGKRKGHHEAEQNDIEDRLADLALSGKTVCRLKGGDPFIFGRGGEELQYLESRLIDVEVVPGVTSALAAAAFSKIPLTKRGLSSSVAFMTGHPITKVSVADTLVYYMGASVSREIAAHVIESGRSPQSPVAIVRHAAWPDQEIQTGTLQMLMEGALEVESPAIMIMGAVVDA